MESYFFFFFFFFFPSSFFFLFFLLFFPLPNFKSWHGCSPWKSPRFFLSFFFLPFFSPANMRPRGHLFPPFIVLLKFLPSLFLSPILFPFLSSSSFCFFLYFSFLLPFFPLFFLPLSAAFLFSLSSIYYSPGCFLLFPSSLFLMLLFSF